MSVGPVKLVEPVSPLPVQPYRHIVGDTLLLIAKQSKCDTESLKPFKLKI
jgi:hypothetical protein